MASTFTDLGLELMATGENAGTWGTKTNANLSLIEQLTGGVLQVSIAGGAGTTALTIADGALTGTAQQRIIELTGSITGNRIVTFPLLTENFYIIKNGTTNGSGTPTVQLKAASGSGATVTFSATDKGYKLIYLDGVATNTGLFEASIGEANEVTLTGTQTLTNKTLTAPKIGTSILDTNGNELLLLTATSSAVNELTLANAATGNGPILSATGETNVDINLNPKGTGVLKSATAAVKIAGLETMWVPAAAMFGTTTNGADPQQVETTAGRPDMKVLDFDAGTAENAQFSVAFPKSWNEGTITYQVFWSPSNTSTGNCLWQLYGVSVADNGTIDVTYGTQQQISDAGHGTVEDQQVSSVSSALTVKSAAADTQTYFQVTRNAADGSDTFTGDARLLGIKIFFTTDAANDA
jgi:hypothetical protein